MAMLDQQDKGSSLERLPRTFGYPRFAYGQAVSQLQQMQGREHFVQLNIDDKPVNQDDDLRSKDDRGTDPVLDSRDPPVMPHNTQGVSNLGTPDEALSAEERFARIFGYHATPSLSIEPTHTDINPCHPSPSESHFPQRQTRPRSCPPTRKFTEDFIEEGKLVGLPEPPLLRPASFWRNTWRSALHTPSFHLVRRSTFLAAGLAFDRPVCDLSAFAVESRITIGKTKGLGGSAAVPVGLDVLR